MTTIRFILAGQVSKHDMGEKVVAKRDMTSRAYGFEKGQAIKKGDVGTLVGVATFTPGGEFGIVRWDNGKKNDCPLGELALAGGA